MSPFDEGPGPKAESRNYRNWRIHKDISLEEEKCKCQRVIFLSVIGAKETKVKWWIAKEPETLS